MTDPSPATPETLEVMGEVARLLDESSTLGSPTGDDRLCARCNQTIAVRAGDEWSDGDWCAACWTDWGERAAQVLPILKALADRAEASESEAARWKREAMAWRANPRLHIWGCLCPLCVEVRSARSANDAAEKGAGG